MIRLHVDSDIGGTQPKVRRLFEVSPRSQTLPMGPEPVDTVLVGGKLTILGVNQMGKLLLKAALDGNVDEIRYLLNKGALFTADWLGITPLHLAARHNHLEICEILLRAGISKDARTKVDKTALHLAAYEGNSEIVETLLGYGAEPDCKDLLSMTPLHWAVQMGHYKVIQCLLKYGAQTSHDNKFGLKPADIAIQIGRQDLVEMLNMGSNVEPLVATQQLTLELAESADSELQDNEFFNEDDNSSSILLETILSEDSSASNDTVVEFIDKKMKMPLKVESMAMEQPQDDHIAESMKLLQQHGITMLPNEEDTILTTVIQSGHSVVLTDVGKEMLNSVNGTKSGFEGKFDTENGDSDEEKGKIITKMIRPEEFLHLNNGKFLMPVSGKLVPKGIKQVVMKQNKLIPIKPKDSPASAIEAMTIELTEARKTIEELRLQLRKKEQEAERYRQQLNKLTQES